MLEVIGKIQVLLEVQVLKIEAMVGILIGVVLEFVIEVVIQLLVYDFIKFFHYFNLL